jgi:hypothetical protein
MFMEKMIIFDSVLEDLILDFLEWLAKRVRTYEDVMDAWRTSCPKLPVWEEASGRGLVIRDKKRIIDRSNHASRREMPSTT